MSVSTAIRPLDLSNRRYWQQNAKMAVRDVFDAITELVTNADDAYTRAKCSGRIDIEIERRRKGVPNILRVRDRAGGLTARDMELKIGRVANRQDSGMADGERVRGTNSRGAKDVAALGRVTFESIGTDGRYARCAVTPRGDFEIPITQPVTKALRKQLGLSTGTGSVVTIEVDPTYSTPLHKNLKAKIEQLVPLREILSDCDRELFLHDLNQEQGDRLRWEPPAGKDRVKETISISGYPPVSAKLVIKRAGRPLGGRGKFRQGGILIKSRRAVHEATLFAPEFEHDPHACLFFGHLRCEYIDDLWNEFDERMEKDLPPDPKNPGPILDPSRQGGLMRDHPFFRALQAEVVKRLRPLVEEERRQEAAKQAQIENRQTRRRLNDLEKLATQFMQEQQEESDDDFDNRQDGELPKGTGDVSLSPIFAQMILGQSKRFSLTVNQTLRPELTVGSMVQIECETADISVDGFVCPLEAHPSIDGLLRATWMVKAERVTKATGIVVRSGSVVASSVIEVVASEKDLYVDVIDLKFARQRYRLHPDKPKRVRLLAPCPGLLYRPTPVELAADHPQVKIAGDRVCHPRVHLGIAECRVTVTCSESDVKATLTAEVAGRKATAELLCGPAEGDALKIELKDRGDTWNQEILQFSVDES